MGDYSDAGQKRHAAMVDGVLAVLDEQGKGRTKSCEGLHALNEAFVTYMAREMPQLPEKQHGLEIVGDIALRSGYEAAGMAARPGDHGPEAARLHEGIRQLVANLVRALFMGNEPHAKCPGCTSQAVITGLADGLITAGIAPELAIAAVREKGETLRLATPASGTPASGTPAAAHPPASLAVSLSLPPANA